MSAELEQKRRSVRVLELLTKSFMAHSRGDLAACDAALTEALECDAAVVSVVRGGMVIGELPRPQEDPVAWDDYVGANQEALARLEAEEAQNV